MNLSLESIQHKLVLYPRYDLEKGLILYKKTISCSEL